MDQLVGQDIERFIEIVDVSVNSTNVGFGMERVLLHREDGNLVRAEQIITDLQGDDTALKLVAIRDISNEILLQSQLQHSRRMASVGHMAATVAHEINNPLAVIQLRLDLVQGQGIAGGAQEHLAVVSDHVQRISHIVRNMRSFSKPSKLLGSRSFGACRDHCTGHCEWPRQHPLDVQFNARPSDVTVLGVPEHVERRSSISFYICESR